MKPWHEPADELPLHGLTVVGRNKDRIQKLCWTDKGVWVNERGETVPAPDYWALPEDWMQSQSFPKTIE